MFKETINKIIIIFAVLISIPAIIFSIDEISSLNETERVIDTVYKDQLNTILSSVDQYTYDIINGWSRKINLIAVNWKNRDPKKFKENIKNFLTLNPPLQMAVFADLNRNDADYFYALGEDSISALIKTSWKDIINSNEPGIRRITNSNRDSIRRIEAVVLGNNGSEELFFFPLDYTDNTSDYCAVLVKPASLIKYLLIPEINILSCGKFTVAITDVKTNREIFLSNGTKPGNIQLKSNLMLLPNYAAAIYFKGKTIAELVKERANRNLITIFIIDIILFAGIWFMLKNLRKEMELAKIKSDFVSNVSHELRTPLSLISLFSETLAEGRISSPEKKNEYYKIIYQESSRLSRIVDKILSFYKIEQKNKTYIFRQVKVNSVVEKILDTYGYHLSNSGFKYGFNKQGDIPDITGDEEAISEAVINLIDNAMKYCSDRKEIEISTGCDNGFAYIKVKDYGIGIPQDKQKNIFEKFYRVQNGLVHNTKGAGLGLTIVKNIMTEHKGEVIVESSEFNGSCFTLRFPAVKEFLRV